MERNQHEVLDWSCSAAQSSLQDPRSTIYHLFEIVVHRAGNIEDKGQRWGAVIRAGVSLHRRDGWGARAGGQRQNEETNEKRIHSCLKFIRPLFKRVIRRNNLQNQLLNNVKYVNQVIVGEKKKDNQLIYKEKSFK